MKVGPTDLFYLPLIMSLWKIDFLVRKLVKGEALYQFFVNHPFTHLNRFRITVIIETC